jgi:hypothetical protein
MILFHGTKKQNVGAILKQGLQAPPVREWRESWWSNEIGIGPSVFLSNEPKAGIGSSPVAFASSGDADGYLIVVNIPKAELDKQLRGIWTTHDIDTYYDLRWRIDDWYEECLGRDYYSTSDSNAVLRWVKSRHPWTVGRLCIRDGWIRPSPHWLLSRKRVSVCLDCQLLAKAIPAKFVAQALKVYSGTSGRILPQFDPKRQTKRKHKEKTFRSLVWHHVSRTMK